ncbi:MAG: hypothetical protein OEV80_06230, partial [candidate division Zixibacteria bacterium]|nr:hypothetical protein [candidate division Zixibacteria bacterium]
VRRRNPASPLWSFTTKSITYPVAVGNSWRYRSNSWYENLQPKSLVPRFGDTTFVIREVEIDNFDSAIGGPGRYRFHTGTTGRTRPSEASCYYEVHQDGLYMTMAEVGTGSGVWPKTGKGISYSFAGRTFNSTNALSAFLGAGIPGGFAAGSDHDYPRKSLQYPLRIGTQWTYTENHATPGSVVRRVVDRQSIEIGLGRFDCFVIRQLHNLAEDGTWDNTLEIVDYVAAEGLIKRRTIARDVQINDWGHAYPIGTADIVIEAFLTDFDLIDP